MFKIILVLSVLSLALPRASAQAATQTPDAQSPVGFIALPPPPPPPPGLPGNTVFCPEGMWVCPCDPGETTCPVVPLPSNLPVLYCANVLYEREVLLDNTLPTGGFHTFWYTHMWLETDPYDGWAIDDILDGGPTVPCPTCGFLGAWVTPGFQGEEAGDNINNPAASPVPGDIFGPGFYQCRAAWDMKTYVSNWPQAISRYKPLGPNCNTITHNAAIAAALPVVEPEEWVPGW